MRQIQLKNTAQRPLPELDVVKAAISFANGAAIEINGLQIPLRLEHHPLVASEGATLLVPPNAPEPARKEDCTKEERPTRRRVAELINESVENYRLKVRKRLDTALTDPMLIARETVDNLEAIRSEPVLEVAPPTKTHPGGIRLTTYFPFDTVFELCEVGIALLLDVQRDLLKDLCKCELPSCKIFFLYEPVAGKRGPPRRLHCSAAHQTAHNKETASTRSQKSRTARKQRKTSRRSRSGQPI